MLDKVVKPFWFDIRQTWKSAFTKNIAGQIIPRKALAPFLSRKVSEWNVFRFRFPFWGNCLKFCFQYRLPITSRCFTFGFCEKIVKITTNTFTDNLFLVYKKRSFKRGHICTRHLLDHPTIFAFSICKKRRRKNLQKPENLYFHFSIRGHSKLHQTRHRGRGSKKCGKSVTNYLNGPCAVMSWSNWICILS